METNFFRVRAAFVACPVMIRGIPKEGWKPGRVSLAHDAPRHRVMIRGIPKEGWKQIKQVTERSEPPS